MPSNHELPFSAVIFDLDGVVTKTALVHGAAWKEMFDRYLRLRETRDGEPFREFTHEGDYLPYVDGKPRYEGVRSFLESRGIHLPYGEADDPADRETVCGLGNQKNVAFREVLKKQGVQQYASTVNLIRELRAAGVHVGVASSSKNCQFVLQAAGIEDLFETRVDGMVSAELGLKGKPQPDIFIRAAENLGVAPAQAIVVEDAVSGVQAGQAGAFGLVIGIAREQNGEALLTNGADVVIEDFAGIEIATIRRWFLEKSS